MLRAIGPMELMVILGVAVLLFGGKRFAEFGKGLGTSITEFRKAMREANEAKKDVQKDGTV